MTAARNIPDDVRGVQIAASDPRVSAWVTANAGSGKTHVLAQRVINLLLDGVDPAKILCITFTKAAAANMANRVFGQLAQWTALDDSALDREIAKISRVTPDAVRRARARRLFAAALETPGGLKVQTIHAFCTRLLHQFPFEANVAARFTVLDDSATAQLLDQLTLAVLLEASAQPDSALGRALETAIVAAADQTFKDVIGEAIGKRDALARWIAQAGGVEAAIAGLSRTLGVDPNERAEDLENKFLSESLFPIGEWPALIAVLAQGSTNDKKHIKALDAARAAAGRARADEYLQVFCRSDLEPRKSILTKAIADKYPELLERLKAEQDRLCKLLERRRAIDCRDRSAALVIIAAAVIARYQTEKERRGLLDYDDLIGKTLALFENVSAAWVLYKLDLGIDHVLIDEAQDTSSAQWDIIRKIVGDFTAGAGARGALERTLFAVGDDKQSIFSFQGAAPLKFTEMRIAFERAFNAALLPWRSLRFEASFRSGETVLGAVDDVFHRPQAFAGLTADPVETVHRALPGAAPGLVEIWSLLQADGKREIEGWDAPFDTLTATSPQVRLGRKIANTVAAWIKRGRRPGDVLILVRQRGPLFEAIIRALKDARIAVAGADRLVLTEHIAVMDLMVLADALLLPDDDLALATVLKSPLFGLNDEQLFDLAWQRKASLRTALRARSEPAFAAIADSLDRLAANARRQTPFSFYADVLGAERGRARILARLGGEAADALDEFLNLALDYERRETPSLQGFVAWLRAAKTDVKRDMEMARDEVRVMTVHGAKGLEAPVVILADTTTRPSGPRDPRLFALPVTCAPPDTPANLVWASARVNDVGPMAQARDDLRRAAQDEYRRLLYVAMTRAIERLIVCGTEGANRRPEGCWYDLVSDALLPAAVEEPADDGDGNVWRYRKVAEMPAQAVQPAAAASVVTLPDWLRRDAKPEPHAFESIAPSRAYDDEFTATWKPSAQAMRERKLALERGRHVHRLMQSLPDIRPERRAEAADKYLARAANAFNIGDRRTIAGQVLNLLEHPHFYELFGPGSRAEVPIAGRLARAGKPPFIVSGQVDRLAVTGDEVLIADYKTNRPAPANLADAPKAYIAQLALYRAVLAPLFPGRTLRAALVWTDVPDLMEVSAADLDAALAQVTSA